MEEGGELAKNKAIRAQRKLCLGPRGWRRCEDGASGLGEGGGRGRGGEVRAQEPGALVCVCVGRG